MTAVDATSSDDGTVKDRLIRAADAEITARGINAVQMEVVAKSAGVSRATAFRQLGILRVDDVDEMLDLAAYFCVGRLPAGRYGRRGRETSR